MSAVQYTEKFIAFVDVLGWKSLVRASGEGGGLSPGELCEIVDMLGKAADREDFEKYGPMICPQAHRIRKNINFRITRFSDSVLISVETSPAGLINLVSQCWKACMELLSKKGIMCRGYIERGRIYHTSEYQIGVGISDVVKREKQVSIFSKNADEVGTPFIEIDTGVVQYVEDQTDECVKEMFSRFVMGEESGRVAIFPFKRLDPSIFFGAGSGAKFDPERERASVNVVRGWIHRVREHVESHVDPSNESARQKGAQYVRMLDAQLVACDQMERGLYTKLAKSPAYFGLFRTRIDGSGGLALPNIRWATSSGGASSLMIRVRGRPGFFLVLWTSLRLSFMDTLPADKSCRSSN